MSETLKLGNGNWATKKDSLLAYNSENNNFKPLPFNFTRNSSATRINKEGLIETVGSGIPRVDYSNDSNGALLLEPTRTNLVTYSEDIESWSTSGLITKENNVATSPNGTLNAGTIITNDASGFHRITQSISVSTNSTYTSSLFIKKVQSQTNFMGIGFIFTGGTTDVGYVIFDAVNGIAVSADARIDVISEVKDFGDYWNLQSTATDNGGNTSLQFNIYATLSTNGTTTGLGISSKRTIWGIQLEQGSYATSYIPTSGGVVTRVAESCSQTPPSGIIGQTEGTVFLDSKMALQSINNYQLFSINNGGGSDRIRILTATGNRLRFIYQLDGGTLFYNFYNPTDYGDLTNLKIAFTYKSGDIKVYINGVLADSSTNTFTIAEKLIDIDIATSTGGYNQMLFNDIKLYNTALTDQELQALTS